MAIGKKLLLDTTLDDSPTSASAAQDFNGITPQRVTLLVEVTKTNSPTNVVLSVQVSPDAGQTLIDYDKLLVDAGNDAPASSVTYTATAEDIVSLSPEDVIPYLNVSLVATGTTSSATFRVRIWIVYAY